jgi:hypothetical protein
MLLRRAGGECRQTRVIVEIGRFGRVDIICTGSPLDVLDLANTLLGQSRTGNLVLPLAPTSHNNGRPSAKRVRQSRNRAGAEAGDINALC